MNTPNKVINCNGNYYISYNRVDRFIYGSDTTAIVLGQMQLFLILNGDHRKELSIAANNNGQQGCIDYFIAHIEQANHVSEHIKAYSGLELLGQSNIDRINAAIKVINHDH